MGVQPRVLSHNAVQLFVNHGGAGAIQEAIWYGQPMLCVPHAWDHYYYGWIAQKLGIGEVMAKRHLDSRHFVTRKLKKVLSRSGQMKKRAHELSMEVRSQFAAWDIGALWDLCNVDSR